ncbi:MAG: tyrosine-type recombinase/integrase [Actinomycetota bacterium]
MEGIGALAEQWLQGAARRGELTGTTPHVYGVYLRNFVRFVGEDTPIGQISTRQVEQWAGQRKRDGSEYAPNSKNTRIKPIRAVFEWAMLVGLVEDDPTRTVRPAKLAKRVRKGLDPEDVTRMLYVAGMRDRTIILVGVQLGLRVEEIAAMDVSDWSRRDRMLYVWGKGSKERTIPVAGEMEGALRTWVHLGLGGRRAGPMWPTRHRKRDRLGKERIAAIVKSVAEVADVDATTHTLRHTCGLDMARIGVPMPIIQAWFGHERVDTTGLYAVPGMGDLRRYADARSYLPAGLEVPDIVA